MLQSNSSEAQILDFPGPRTRREAALNALPSKSIKRWTAAAKKAVLEAIRLEAITVVEACRDYGLTADELESWDKREQAYGRNGLMATQVSRYRRAAQHRSAQVSLVTSQEADPR